jgi:hypothetical protein
MSTWQPIETAPRDGTWFLIACAEDGYSSYEVGAYDPLMVAKYEPVECGLYSRSEAVAYEWRGFNNFHCATHWMPLPAPPEATP